MVSVVYTNHGDVEAIYGFWYSAVETAEITIIIISDKPLSDTL